MLAAHGLCGYCACHPECYLHLSKPIYTCHFGVSFWWPRPRAGPGHTGIKALSTGACARSSLAAGRLCRCRLPLSPGRRCARNARLATWISIGRPKGRPRSGVRCAIGPVAAALEPCITITAGDSVGCRHSRYVAESPCVMVLALLPGCPAHRGVGHMRRTCWRLSANV